MTSLSLTAEQHRQLRDHLLTGDGLEAVAVALCGRASAGGRHRLLVRRIVPIPHERCRRAPDSLTWPTDALRPLIAEAEACGGAILKVHSHPGGYPDFSWVDDRADADLFPSIAAAVGDAAGPHASAIMLPEGVLFGRAMLPEGGSRPLDGITIIGDDIVTFGAPTADGDEPAAAIANRQAFGPGMVARLRRLRIAVVGCSGTGSLVIEMLARLGVGELVLVDPQGVEHRNLNRIVGAELADAEDGRSKADVHAERIERMGFRTRCTPLTTAVEDRGTIRLLGTCDIVIGCLDQLEPRNLLTRLATYYLQPYLDLGVRLVADGKGGIDAVCGGVHYVQPGYSPLDARGVYALEDLRAEGLRRRDPIAYQRQLAEKYVRGVPQESPPVISVNAMIAATAINDLLARLHPFRTMGNRHSSLTVNLMEMDITPRRHHERDPELIRHVGRGDVLPLLGIPAAAA